MTKIDVLDAIAQRLTSQVVVGDIGARWGASEAWRGLGNRLTLVGFDPDEAECEKLNQSTPDTERYVPFALSNRMGSETLFVTKEPACSSMFPPIEQLATIFPELAVTELVGSELVECTTLDQWAVAAKAAPFDCLKLDVQGAE